MPYNPYARLDVALPSDAFGHVIAQPDSITWDLKGYFSTPSATFSGLTLDPTGQYVMQASQAVWMDSGPVDWILTGDGFLSGMDASTNKSLLVQSAPAALFTATSHWQRQGDEGVIAKLYLAAPTSPDVTPSTYFQFAPDCRLAIEPGQPIRLQARGDDGTWNDLTAASSLGDCEDYLTSVGRNLLIDVLPMTDAAWNLDPSISDPQSGPPPNLLVVSLNNGDAVLSVPCTNLLGGAITISGQNRKWNCALAKKRFAFSAGVIVPPQARARAFQVEPRAHFTGHVPATVTLGGGIVVTDVNKAGAELTIAATTDDTNLAFQSVFLSTIDAEFPSVQQAPNPYPAFVAYEPIYTEISFRFDPVSRTMRWSGVLVFNNNSGQFSPGLVKLGVRAARLYLGQNGPGSEMLVSTGWTALEPVQGLEWEWVDGQNYFAVSFSDRLRKGDADQNTCGYRLPDDGLCHYTVMRELCNRDGITDDWLNFPFVGRYDSTPYFYLPRGTNLSPALQFHPSMPTGTARQKICSLSAAQDPVSGQPQPMVLGTDPFGGIEYFPLPPGLCSIILDPTMDLASAGLAPVMTFRTQPGFDGNGQPLYNELKGLKSFVGLTNVRSTAVFEGIDLYGDVVVGWNYNERVGGGPSADPDAPGYIGTDVPYYEISRYVNSVEYAEQLANTASVFLQFPSVGADLRLHLQPWLFPLTVIAVEDFHTMGTYAPVPFYATEITHTVDRRGTTFHGETRCGARLLGEA